MLSVSSLSISSCYGQEIKTVPGTVVSDKTQISTPAASAGQTWVLVNTTEPVICYEEKTASQMILQLENAKDYKTQVDDLKQDNAELEKQIALLKEANKLLVEQRDIADQTIELYKDLLNAQKEFFEKQIENQKPSIWGKIGVALEGLGIGILIGVLL